MIATSPRIMRVLTTAGSTMFQRWLRLARWTYVVEVEGKPENGWVIHRKVLALLAEVKKTAEAEALKVTIVNNTSDKGHSGGLLKRGIVGGAKNLYNWWVEPEVEESGSP